MFFLKFFLTLIRNILIIDAGKFSSSSIRDSKAAADVLSLCDGCENRKAGA